MLREVFKVAVLVLGLPALGCRQDTTAPNLPSDSPAFRAEKVYDSNIVTPFQVTGTVPCPNRADGEDVLFSGEVHSRARTLFDGRGDLHIVVVENWRGVSGTGLITGAKYQVTSTTTVVHTFKAGEVYTRRTTIQFVGPGPGNNFYVHSRLTLRVNANGLVTVSRDDFTRGCR